MKKITHIVLLVVNLLGAKSYAALQPGEGIVFDTATGNYLVSYRDDAGTANDPLVQIPFVPSTKIDPILFSSTKLIDSWNIRYGYVLTNGVNAQQSVIDLSFFGLPVNANISGTTTTITDGNRQMDIFEPVLSTPNADWYGSGARVPKERTPPNGEVNVGWHYDYIGKHSDPLIGIQPGSTLGGFSLISSDLPGLFAAKMEGNGTGHFAFPGYAPGGDILGQIHQLRDNDFVPVNAAAPMIAIPAPYDAATTLEAIQTHVHTWIAKQLLNATFSAQLDTSFQAAIAAYRANQPQTAIIQLQTLRTLIKQQQPDADKNDTTPTVNLPAPPATIDLLAARILYFDLGYVMQR